MIWEKYLRLKAYIDRKNIVSRSCTNWDMFLGNQWKGLKTGGMPMPMHNIIEPIVKFKVGSVCQNNITAQYSDMKSNNYGEVYTELNRYFEYKWEKLDMDTKVWEMCLGSCVQGDAYMYFSNDDVQILPNSQVLLADEKNPRLEDQPYIILRCRSQVKWVKEEALKNGIPPEEVERITSDGDNDYLIGDQTDRDAYGDDGKVTTALYMEKSHEGVKWGMACKACEFKPVTLMAVTDSGGGVVRPLNSYPMVNLVWQDIPNSARGQGVVEPLINNQYEINKTLARRVMAAAEFSFPRMVYDSSLVQNPSDFDIVGAPIELSGGGVNAVDQMIKYLNPMSMSQDIKLLEDELVEQTRTLAGASENVMGNVDPQRVAASALQMINEQATLSLKQQQQKVIQLYERIARLWADLWIVTNPNGITEKAGEIAIGGKDLLRLTPDVRVDVSQNTPYSRESEKEDLKGWLESGQITFDEYVQLSDYTNVPKHKLEAVLEARKQNQMNQLEYENQQLGNQLGGTNEVPGM